MAETASVILEFTATEQTEEYLILMLKPFKMDLEFMLWSFVVIKPQMYERTTIFGVKNYVKEMTGIKYCFLLVKNFKRM